MDYFIIAEKIRRWPGPCGNQLYNDWWMIGPERESARDPNIPYKFATREWAQAYLDKEKPEGREWEIFFIANDDYENF
jgi:hypothetical protein